MDIGSLPKYKDTAFCDILHPETGEYQFGIEVYGPTSDFFRRAHRDVARKYIEDDPIAESRDLIAMCTCGFKDLTTGEDAYECTYENALKLYTDYPYVLLQVDIFLAGKKSFLESA